MCFKIENQNILLFIKVKSQATASFVKILNDRLIISTNVVREKGKANKAILKFIAKSLNLSSSDITLKSGDTSELKTIILPLEALDELEAILKKIDK